MTSFDVQAYPKYTFFDTDTQYNTFLTGTTPE